MVIIPYPTSRNRLCHPSNIRQYQQVGFNHMYYLVFYGAFGRSYYSGYGIMPLQSSCDSRGSGILPNTDLGLAPSGLYALGLYQAIFPPHSNLNYSILVHYFLFALGRQGTQQLVCWKGDSRSDNVLPTCSTLLSQICFTQTRFSVLVKPQL